MESFQIFGKFLWPETWHLRHWLHFWQLKTATLTNTLWPLNKEWQRQRLQFLRCFLRIIKLNQKKETKEGQVLRHANILSFYFFFILPKHVSVFILCRHILSSWNWKEDKNFQGHFTEQERVRGSELWCCWRLATESDSGWRAFPASLRSWQIILSSSICHVHLQLCLLDVSDCNPRQFVKNTLAFL